MKKKNKKKMKMKAKNWNEMRRQKRQMKGNNKYGSPEQKFRRRDSNPGRPIYIHKVSILKPKIFIVDWPGALTQCIRLI